MFGYCPEERKRAAPYKAHKTPPVPIHLTLKQRVNLG